MNVPVIPRTAIKTSLKLARLPLDVAIRMLPGDGLRTRAQLALDRLDATARTVAGTVTADPDLREEARPRRGPVKERQRDPRLRTEAHRPTSGSRRRVHTLQAHATRRR